MVEGKYMLLHPFWIVFRPKLALYREDGGKRLHGALLCLGCKKTMRLIKQKENELIFQIPVNIVNIEMVVRFNSDNSLKGFFDTPLGHFKFGGKMIKMGGL